MRHKSVEAYVYCPTRFELWDRQILVSVAMEMLEFGSFRVSNGKQSHIIWKNGLFFRVLKTTSVFGAPDALLRTVVVKRARGDNEQ